ncbi:hypothetical protein PEC301619_37460 [Pectobacterium carotovorum subsp. carotovorum]|nr:hypothetical protein PEC301619_37460 [Pectobacterium carotovorum subsp. carotovorum]
MPFNGLLHSIQIIILISFKSLIFGVGLNPHGASVG